MMSGRIDVESEPGVGSSFTVYLPQEPVDSSQIGKELAGSLNDFSFTPCREKIKLIRVSMPDCCVLVVDDVEENIFVAKGLMKPYNLQIETAASGYEALEKVRAGNTYDIIFMDHMMPGIDGIETTRLLREEGYNHPIVALTANVVAGVKDIFIESGFDDFIPKPFDIVELDSILKKYNHNKQAQTSFMISRLKHISGLDVNSALSAIGGTEDMYVDTVKITARLMPERIDNIDRYKSNDLESFKVEIHGIKSVLSNIGANVLSISAAQLERAAIDSDTSFITKNYPAFRAGLASLSEELNDALQSGSSGLMDTADKTQLMKIIFDVKAATEEYDSMLALEVLSPYIDYSYDKETDELLRKIVFSLEASDYESALDNIATMEDHIV